MAFGDAVDFTFRGVRFTILNVGSPGWAVSREQYRVTVKYSCHWDDRFKAPEALLGTTRTVETKLGQGFFSRRIPHSIEWDETLDGLLFARAITDAQPMGPLPADGPGAPEFEEVHLTVSYEWVPYPILEDDEATTVTLSGVGVPWEGDACRYVHVHSRSISKQFSTKGGVVWKDDPASPSGGRRLVSASSGIGVPILIPVIEWTYTWFEVPRRFAPLGVARSIVNQATNAAAFGEMAEKTVLLNSFDFEDTVLPSLEPSITLKYVFHEYLKGVSYLPDPTKGNTFQRVVRENDHNADLFPTADFNALFLPEF